MMINFIGEVLAQQHSTGKNPVFIGTSTAGPANFGLAYDSLGDFISLITPIFFSVFGIIVSFYFIIGAFELITSQGDKAHIVSARSKIYHSVIALILLLLLFLVMQYILYDVFNLTPFKII